MPADTAVITPVLGSIVATDGVPEDQVPPASPFEVKVVEPLLHIACVPLIVPAFAFGLTVKVCCAVGVPLHPPVIVNMILHVPAPAAVTNPVAG